jgi:hypothetical protein
MSDRHSLHSTLRERIVEHVFVGDVLRTLWRRGITDVEVLRPEFDVHGYDVVLSRGPIVRHVQLKAQVNGSVEGRKARLREVHAGRALALKPSGCVIKIGIHRDTLELGPFWWFGDGPGEPLPDISGYGNPRRTTPNMQGEKPLRRNYHKLGSSVFVRLETIDQVVDRLFGQLPTS